MISGPGTITPVRLMSAGRVECDDGPPARSDISRATRPLLVPRVSPVCLAPAGTGIAGPFRPAPDRRRVWHGNNLRVLKPGGAAIINVAAMTILRGNHSVLSAELRRYSRAGLRALLEPAGFRVERMRYTHAALFPVMVTVRGMQRLVGLAPEDDALGDITVPPAPVNAALSAALALEAGLARVVPMPCGSSLLCLARKPA